MAGSFLAPVTPPGAQWHSYYVTGMRGISVIDWTCARPCWRPDPACSFSITVAMDGARAAFGLRVSAFPSSRRPTQLASADDVAMKVRHRFTGVGPIVKHQT